MEELQSLVLSRFATIKDLEDFLTLRFDTISKVKLELSSQNFDADCTPDWDLCGTIETNDFWCDIDIYYLYDKENRIVITEIAEIEYHEKDKDEVGF